MQTILWLQLRGQQCKQGLATAYCQKLVGKGLPELEIKKETNHIASWKPKSVLGFPRKKILYLNFDRVVRVWLFLAQTWGIKRGLCMFGFVWAYT